MKKKSNWIVGLLGTVLLFSAGYRIEPRLLWLLESALLVAGLFLMKEAVDDFLNEKEN
jgi:uncharacterized membrane protein YdcZ (DUF606 family)